MMHLIERIYQRTRSDGLSGPRARGTRGPDLYRTRPPLCGTIRANHPIDRATRGKSIYLDRCLFAKWLSLFVKLCCVNNRGHLDTMSAETNPVPGMKKCESLIPRDSTEKVPTNEAQASAIDDETPPSTGSSDGESPPKEVESDDENLSIWKLVPLTVALCATLFCTSLVS